MANAFSRAAWQGYISLGRLGIPVRLYAVIQSLRPRFVQLHESDGSPVTRELRCQAEHRKIESAEVVRAIEYEPGKYVTLTDNELSTSGRMPAKTLAVQQFCEPSDIPSIYYDKPFYIVPTKGGERAYALLREVLGRLHKLAFVQFVLYTQEHIGMVGVHGDLLLLQQLHFAGEIAPRSGLKTPPLPKPTPAELDALSEVVRRFSGPLYIEDYHDEYSEQVQELVGRKVRGLPSGRRERIAPQATHDTELISALHDTLEEKRLIGDSISRK